MELQARLCKSTYKYKSTHAHDAHAKTHADTHTHTQGWMPFGPAWMDHLVLQFLSATAAHYPASTAADTAAAVQAAAQQRRQEYHQPPIRDTAEAVASGAAGTLYRGCAA